MGAKLATAAPATAAQAASSGGFLSGITGLVTAANPLVGAVAGVSGALQAAAAGNAESGTKGNASFGGIQVGSKVVGSGSATTVPPPETPAQTSLYTTLSPNAAASPMAWAPIAGIAAVAFVIFTIVKNSSSR